MQSSRARLHFGFDHLPDRALCHFQLVYHGLKLLQAGADVDRAAKHLADCTDFQNLRGNRLAAILSYLQEITATNPHWDAYRNALEQLAIAVEHYRG
jgi:hypothetical protein